VRKTTLLHGARRSSLLRWPAVGATILLASCKPAGVLDPQGPIASAERLLLINSTAIMLVVVVPVIVATLAFAWWYRSSNPRATRSLDFGDHMLAAMQGLGSQWTMRLLTD